MKLPPLASHRLFSICVIFGLTSMGWWVLSGTLNYRTQNLHYRMATEVSNVWGPPIQQAHPKACYRPTDGSLESLEPTTSEITVNLKSDPRKRGLVWCRTYDLDFKGHYTFCNPTQITQILEVSAQVPAGVTLRDFKFTLGEAKPQAGNIRATPQQNVMRESISVAPGGKVALDIAYRCRGTDDWIYNFTAGSRVTDFKLGMTTSFQEVNFPQGTGSPTDMQYMDASGCVLTWDLADAIAVQGIGMDMPSPINAGPIAANIARWAPLSLALFFGVMVLMTIMRGTPLHPMHYLFVAAGIFVFPLLFAYTLDVMDVTLSFLIAALMSALMVCGYLQLVAGRAMLSAALAAHLSYVVLFGYSFFHKGLTGLTLVVIGTVTLSGLMFLTAKVDWAERLGEAKPLPA